MEGIHLNTHPKTGVSVKSPKGVGGQAAARRTVPGGDVQAQRLAKACADFESIFVEQLFKTMRASVPGTGLLDGGRAEEIYTAMLDQQIAHDMAHGQGSLGLANQVRGNLALESDKGTAAGPQER